MVKNKKNRENGAALAIFAEIVPRFVRKSAKNYSRSVLWGDIYIVTYTCDL